MTVESVVVFRKRNMRSFQLVIQYLTRLKADGWSEYKAAESKDNNNDLMTNNGREKKGMNTCYR
jgi:hypothetical protein